MLIKIYINCICTITLDVLFLCKNNCTHDCHYRKTPDIMNIYLKGTTLKSLCSPVAALSYNYITMDIRNNKYKEEFGQVPMCSLNFLLNIELYIISPNSQMKSILEFVLFSCVYYYTF